MRTQEETRALEQQAHELRRQGLGILAIASQLHVGKGRVADWVRGIPGPQQPRSATGEQRRKEGYHRYWEKESATREARRQAISAEAAIQIGDLTEREVLITGALAYWCEGSKNKPHQRRDRVTFMNSDPTLIRFFLHFLRVAGVPQSGLRFSVSIHESADVVAAERFWQKVTGAGREQFNRAVMKRHTPKTVWDNTDDSYHGCLRLDVCRSKDLYRKIEGWVAAATVAD
jgi:hypothetical protein